MIRAESSNDRIVLLLYKGSAAEAAKILQLESKANVN